MNFSKKSFMLMLFVSFLFSQKLHALNDLDILYIGLGSAGLVMGSHQLAKSALLCHQLYSKKEDNRVARKVSETVESRLNVGLIIGNCAVGSIFTFGGYKLLSSSLLDQNSILAVSVFASGFGVSKLLRKTYDNKYKIKNIKERK